MLYLNQRSICTWAKLYFFHVENYETGRAPNRSSFVFAKSRAKGRVSEWLCFVLSFFLISEIFSICHSSTAGAHAHSLLLCTEILDSARVILHFHPLNLPILLPSLWLPKFIFFILFIFLVWICLFFFFLFLIQSIV